MDSCFIYFTVKQYHYLFLQTLGFAQFVQTTVFLDASQSYSVVSSGHNLCFNACSIFPKRFDLAAYLATSVNAFDIIAVTESFLDSSIKDSLIVPSSYTGHQLDRNRYGGGLLVMVKESLSVTRRVDLETDCELLGLKYFLRLDLEPSIVHPILKFLFFIPLIAHCFQFIQST